MISQNHRVREARLRSLGKAISWRCVGTLDTFIVSLVVLTITGVATGSKFQAVQISGGIAGVEVVTKIILYYFHERAWMRIRLGRNVDLAPPSNALEE